ncbi:hypothetical protein [Moraxella bovis]|uniref:hypothetical protein n=1 Tax=Moraxella bovis TaxID=476 RepID=UPI0022278045|nr:hypothetical protein [Moraxella bovis]UYZ80270.1 hypothetical protein LP113_09465 [Moraxella bovis]
MKKHKTNKLPNRPYWAFFMQFPLVLPPYQWQNAPCTRFCVHFRVEPKSWGYWYARDFRMSRTPNLSRLCALSG